MGFLLWRGDEYDLGYVHSSAAVRVGRAMNTATTASPVRWLSFELIFP